MGEQCFWISRAKIQKSLQKSRAARAKEDTRPAKHQDLAFRNARIEDAANMTNSIIDFVSLGAKYCQYIANILSILTGAIFLAYTGVTGNPTAPLQGTTTRCP
jgi:hypothetical protein